MKTPALFVAAVTAVAAATGCSTSKSAEAKPDAQIAQTPPAVVTDDVASPTSTTNGYYIVNDNLKPVYFDLSQSRLTETAMATITGNAAWLKENPPLLLEIVGTTDERGSSKRNETLAERRALNVKKAYAGLGIPAERIAIVTRADESPNCQTLSEDCLQQSRRAETLIENKSLAARPDKDLQ